MRNMLTAIRHPQLATPIKTDNNTARVFIHGNIQLKDPSHGIWDTTGYVTRRPKVNSISSEEKGQQMKGTTISNIIQRCITAI